MAEQHLSAWTALGPRVHDIGPGGLVRVDVDADDVRIRGVDGTEARVVAPGETLSSDGSADDAIVSSAEEVTQRLRGFASVGVTHLMLLIPGVNPEQVARFAPVVTGLADA